uniref:Uncharacterized protein n=1 Tax=Rhizophora mucronata TaxID=61149 RepID=A0A2P2LB80_RHIMU
MTGIYFMFYEFSRYQANAYSQKNRWHNNQIFLLDTWHSKQILTDFNPTVHFFPYKRLQNKQLALQKSFAYA